MNELDYDMATLGNHEFNYGLDMLDEIYDDANFGYVSANVIKTMETEILQMISRCLILIKSSKRK